MNFNYPFNQLQLSAYPSPVDMHTLLFPALLEDDKCNSHIDVPLTKNKKTPQRDRDRPKRHQEPGRLMGHWNHTEKRRYHWFLEIYHVHFEHKHLRRMDKIFKSMADFIGSRAAEQCRSHHQKMEKKYKSFHNIIFNLRMNHYYTIDLEDMETDMMNSLVKSPSTLINPKLFVEFDHERQCKVELEYKVERECKVEQVEPEEGVLGIEPLENGYKSFGFLEEERLEPLI